MTDAAQAPSADRPKLVELSWDPITRIVGSLGIHTKIDFANRRVAECRSTSSIFRGYSVFMKGKDPRDAHFITSRICGICGDNHATCAVYGKAVHWLRQFTNRTANKEPRWRHNRPQLTTGYQPRTYGPAVPKS